MKRSLISLALAGLLVNVAFAQATLTGDDTYDEVHLVAPKSASKATPERSNSGAAERASPVEAARAERVLGYEPDDDAPGYPFNP